jgi:hypothetical protein
MRLLSAGLSVRTHLRESREIPAWLNHPRGALFALPGALINHRLSKKDVVVFKSPNLKDVHADDHKLAPSTLQAAQDFIYGHTLKY